MTRLSLPGMNLGLNLNQQPELNPITPEEEQSTLGKVLGWLQYAGETLGKPLAAVEGVASGLTDMAQGSDFNDAEWGGGVKNLIPFSDTLGLTDADKRVYGKDLLTRKWGLMDEDSTASSIAGFGLDVAADPLTWLSGTTKALTAAGMAKQAALKESMKTVEGGSKYMKGLVEGMTPLAKGEKLMEAAWESPLGKGSINVSKKVPELAANASAPVAKGAEAMGRTPAMLAQEIREGLRGIVRIKPPLMGGPGWNIGAGSEWAAKAVESGAYGVLSPLPYVRELFSKDVAGVGFGLPQVGKDISMAVRDNATMGIRDMAVAMDAGAGVLEKKFSEVIEQAKAAGHLGKADTFDRLLQRVSELKSSANPGGRLTPNEISDFVLGGAGEDYGTELHKFVSAVTSMQDAIHTRAMDLGAKTANWGSEMSNWAARFGAPGSKAVEAGEAAQSKVFQTTSGVMKHRILEYDIPGGTVNVQAASMDPRLTGSGARNVPFDLRRAHFLGEYINPAIKEDAGRGIFPSSEAINELMKEGGKVDKLLKNLEMRPDSVLKTGIFEEGFVKNGVRYVEKSIAPIADLESIHGMMRQDAKFIEDAASIPKGYTSLGDGWSKIIDRSGKPALSERGMLKFAEETAKSLGTWDDALSKAGGVVEDAQKQLAGRLAVREGAPRASSLFMAAAQEPVKSSIENALESYSKWWKKGVTTLGLRLPAFLSRNVGDAITRAINAASLTQAESQGGYTIGGYTKHLGATASAMVGKGIDKLPHYAGFVRDGGLSSIGTKAMVGEASSLQGKTTKLSDIFAPIFSPKKFYEGERSYAWLRGSAAKTKEEIAAGAVEKGNILTEHTARAYDMSETLARYPIYAAAVENGATGQQAMALVNKNQYKYSPNIGGASPTSFSERVMRPLVPFWGFTQNNVPYHLGQLVMSPGGGEAQTIKAIGNARRELSPEGGYIPDWLREQAAIPLPLGTPEEQPVLRQLGLSLESMPFAFDSWGPFNKRTVGKMLSQTNPLISSGYKALSGMDPYTGRPTKEMKGTTGNRLVDTLIQATPFLGPTIKAGETATDERKADWQKMVDLLTGVKVGTYNFPQGKTFDLLKKQQEAAESSDTLRAFPTYYIPKKYEESASPEDKRTLEILKGLNKQVKEQSEKNKKPFTRKTGLLESLGIDFFQ
jgi:hypothetical protein